MNPRKKLGACLSAIALAIGLAAVVGPVSPAIAVDSNSNEIDDFFESTGWYDRESASAVAWEPESKWYYDQYPLACSPESSTDMAFKFLFAYPNTINTSYYQTDGPKVRAVVRGAVSAIAAAGRKAVPTRASLQTSLAPRVETVGTDSWGVCAPNIEEVPLPASAFDDYYTLKSAIEARGYNRTDRKYMVLSTIQPKLNGQTVGGAADSSDPGTYSGYGESLNQPANGSTFGWSVVYAPDEYKWWVSADTLAHEMTHALGAVHLRSNNYNRSNQGHPSECSDTLCYQGYTGETVVSNCSVVKYKFRPDCNKNDYYKIGSTILGSDGLPVWNVAKSSFLWGNPQPPQLRTTDDRHPPIDETVIVD